MLNDFKKFIAHGNAVELAVGLIMGAAFGKIVSSLVEDVIMPPIGMAIGRVDFSDLAFQLSPSGVGSSVMIRYGLFLNTVISFFIVAMCVYLVVRWTNRVFAITTKKEAAMKDCPVCAESINILAKRCPKCTSILGAMPEGTTA